MKKYLAIIIPLCVGLGSCLFTACDDEESFQEPNIVNVRLTTEEASIDSAAFGEYIAIQGVNLASTQKVFFNDVEATLRTTYITDDNIIVQVPNEIPTVVDNLVKVITKGGEATFNLAIKVPAPSITSLTNEFANDGDEIILSGDYFYNVSEITFGGIEAEAFDVINPTTIKVVVPDGAESGVIEVTSVFGKGTSEILFRDDTNIFMDFDANGKCWGDMPQKDEAGGNVPAPLNGKFVHSYKTNIPGQFWWDDGLVVAHCGAYSTEGTLDKYALKFEINVPQGWLFGWFEMNFSWSHFHRLKLWDTEDGAIAYSTDGKWITVTIPLSEFRTKVDGEPIGDPLTDPAGVKDLVLAFQNEGPEEVSVLNVNYDNFRVVRLP